MSRDEHDGAGKPAMARESIRSLFGEDEPETDPGAVGRADAAKKPRRACGSSPPRRPRGGLSWRRSRPGGQPPSLILWGGPGTGKTTLARLIARTAGAAFVALSAVHSGVKDVRAASIKQGRQRRACGRFYSSTRSTGSTSPSRCASCRPSRTARSSHRGDDREPVVPGLPAVRTRVVSTR